MSNWESVESKLPKLHTQYQKRQMAYQIKMIVFVVLICSLVEHILNIISIVYYSKNCLHQNKPIDEFFKVQLSQLFRVTSFSSWKAFIGKFINVVATFVWNYMDVFVMVVSVGISTRFKQLNADLQQVKGAVRIYEHID